MYFQMHTLYICFWHHYTLVRNLNYISVLPYILPNGEDFAALKILRLDRMLCRPQVRTLFAFRFNVHEVAAQAISCCHKLGNFIQ